MLLESLGDAVARAQALVRQFAPDAAEVVDELLSERRAKAKREG